MDFGGDPSIDGCDGVDENEWSHLKTVKGGPMFTSTSAKAGPCFLGSISHPLFPEGETMVSFSSANSTTELLSSDWALPSYHPSPSSSSSAPFCHMNAEMGSGCSDFNMLGGTPTPFQWMEPEHKALIYKYIEAKVPIPSSNCSRRNLACQNRFFGRPRSLHRPVLTACSIKASDSKHNGEVAKFSTYQCNFASKFLNDFSLTEFPWDKAKLLVKERLIFLGNSALKWSLVVLLSFSFVSDALLAVSINRELLVPLGLFMGVTLADFLRESCREISESGAKGGNDLLQLWGFGLFFVALRIMFLSFRIPGWALFAHIGNGGLMQILWLAKELQLADIALKKEAADSL